MSSLIISSYCFASIGGSQLAFSATSIQSQLRRLFPEIKMCLMVHRSFSSPLYINCSFKYFNIEKLTTRGALFWSDSENSSQIHSPWLGYIVESDIGLSYRPASLCSLAGLYDNTMPESILYPQSRTMNFDSACWDLEAIIWIGTHSKSKNSRIFYDYNCLLFYQLFIWCLWPAVWRFLDIFRQLLEA
jgi:hypothetical protein